MLEICKENVSALYMITNVNTDWFEQKVCPLWSGHIPMDRFQMLTQGIKLIEGWNETFQKQDNECNGITA